MSTDPNSIPLGDPGCKLDAGKLEMGFVLDQFPHALEAIARIGMYGAYRKGYGVANWKQVREGTRRYREAAYRHQIAIAKGEFVDGESGLPHAWHYAWDVLAALEIMLAGDPLSVSESLRQRSEDASDQHQ